MSPQQTGIAHGRGGFTMLEILVVVAIIGLLMGLGLPAYNLSVESSRRSRTKALVAAVATAIAAYPRQSIDWPGGTVRRLWDVDGNLELDGGPSSLGGAYAAAATTLGYQGFLRGSGITLDPALQDADGRVIDAWKRPLRLRFASGPDDQRYGASGVGVWSHGSPGPSASDPDQPQDPAAAITSWGGAP